MYYGEIKEYDIANGTGVRVSLFVSGCRNHCEGCFNKDTWDFKYGKLFTESDENHIIDSVNKPYIKGLSLLGGDPFEPENAEVLYPFILKFRSIFKFEKDIWLYTGYEFEYLIEKSKIDENIKGILNNIDILIDGKFKKDLKSLSIKFRGSSNQRILKNTHSSNNGFNYIDISKEIDEKD